MTFNLYRYCPNLTSEKVDMETFLRITFNLYTYCPNLTSENVDVMLCPIFLHHIQVHLEIMTFSISHLLLKILTSGLGYFLLPEWKPIMEG